MKFSFLLLLTASIASAQLDPREDTKTGALALLPPGSVLTQLKIPRYAANGELNSVSNVEELTIINESSIIAKEVDILLFRPGGEPSTRFALDSAELDRTSDLLVSGDPVAIIDPGGSITATGLAVHIQTKQTWFAGPCRTELTLSRLPGRIPPTSHSTIMPFPALGLAILATAILPGDVTPAELREIDKAVTLDTTAFTTESAVSAAAIESFTADTERLDMRLAGLRSILPASIQTVANEGEPKPAAGNKRPDIEASCSEGIYLDPEENALVYVGDVSFTDHTRGITLTAGEQVKALLTQKPAAEGAKEGKKDKSSNVFGQFDDVKNIIATGGVFITLTFNDGSKATAKSATVFVDNKKQKATLQGGFPTLTKGRTSQRIKKEDGRIVVDLKTGKFTVVGPVEQIINKADIENLEQ